MRTRYEKKQKGKAIHRKTIRVLQAQRGRETQTDRKTDRQRDRQHAHVSLQADARHLQILSRHETNYQIAL